MVVFQLLNISLQKGDMPLFILHVRKVIFQLLNIKKLLFSMLVQKAVFELFNILLQQGANNFVHFLFHAVYIDCKICFFHIDLIFLFFRNPHELFKFKKYLFNLEYLSTFWFLIICSLFSLLTSLLIFTNKEWKGVFVLIIFCFYIFPLSSIMWWTSRRWLFDI